MKKNVLVFILVLVILLGSLSCSKETRHQYYFFVFNSDFLNEEDLDTILGLKDLYTDSEIVTVDVRGLKNACEVYGLLKLQRDRRLKDPSGIQIFGDPSDVPTFEHPFEIEIVLAPQTLEMYCGENFVSDYFYSNFKNDPKEIYGISPYQLSERINEICIIPEWPVIRLPLSTGHFNDFSEKYREYLLLKEELETVNVSISSPIHPPGWYQVAADDIGYFLKRARDEWGIIETVHFFGTTEGKYPLTTGIEGSCKPEDWAFLTEGNICEIYHMSHAGTNNISQTVFDGEDRNDYRCEAILESKTINEVLNGYPYYLNTFGCNPARDMNTNIIITALRGKCVGAIAATTTMYDEVDCMLSADEYESGYDTFSFLYEYLFARHHDITRTDAFHLGQNAISNVLTERLLLEPKHSLEAEKLQKSLISLLGIHYFGLIEP